MTRQCPIARRGVAPVWVPQAVQRAVFRKFAWVLSQANAGKASQEKVGRQSWRHLAD